jgi:hypothetical protein
LQGLGEFRLGWVGSTVGETCFVFDFILDTAHIVDACALTSILPSLSLILDTADTKATPASILRLIWISLLHNVMKRVHNRTM